MGIFQNPKSRVVLNDVATDWFGCPIGVKQGDTISPTLFAIYINDLAGELNQSGLGVEVGADLQLSCLLYADDIVLLADKEDDLQALLKIVNTWCSKWRLEVNLLKTNIMHVHKNRKPRSNFNFNFENKTVDYCEQYRYLGVTLNENLNFEKTTEELSEAAGRALGGIITKMIKNGGFPLKVYKTLYESCVCSVSDYGSEVHGFHQYESLEKLHSRAIRAFLGVPKSAPGAGLRSEINWLEPRSRTQLRMIRMYHRLLTMPNHLLTKKVFLWDLNLGENSNFSTWTKDVKGVLSRNDLMHLFSSNIFDVKSAIAEIRLSLFKKDQAELENQCKRLPKLMTFNKISEFSSDKSYLAKPLSFIQRKFLAKLRLGVLPIRIETGRYERPRKSEAERVCKQCSIGSPECELHFLIQCPRHTLLRTTFYSKITDETFPNMTDSEKFKFILNQPTIAKISSQFIIDAFDNRVTE